MARDRKAKRRGSARKGNTEVISSKLVYEGPVFSVYSDRVREGKHTGQRDVIRHSGSVVMMAVDDRAKSDPLVLLVRQYRYATNLRMWALPAGRRQTRAARRDRRDREEMDAPLPVLRESRLS
jgi:ADP-ribose pyrophosphatase